jgi:hypothetical protein
MSSQLLKDLMKQSKTLDNKEKLDLIMYLARIAQQVQKPRVQQIDEKNEFTNQRLEH